MSDFGVAHIGVGGKTDCGSVRFQLSVGHGCHEFVEERRGGVENGVSLFVFADADTVHDGEDDGSFSALEFRIAL